MPNLYAHKLGHIDLNILKEFIKNCYLEQIKIQPKNNCFQIN